MDIKIGYKEKSYNNSLYVCNFERFRKETNPESSNLVNSKLSTRNFVARSKRPKKCQAENSISPRCFAVKLFTGRVYDARIN